ncbi:hypothetical protein C8R44DRAFT_735059 [Mycena epipterygia]|nr:hypothetical protein C8R44DRAFT_735059 [Mycena epipterygia]
MGDSRQGFFKPFNAALDADAANRMLPNCPQLLKSSSLNAPLSEPRAFSSRIVHEERVARAAEQGVMRAERVTFEEREQCLCAEQAVIVRDREALTIKLEDIQQTAQRKHRESIKSEDLPNTNRFSVGPGGIIVVKREPKVTQVKSEFSRPDLIATPFTPRKRERPKDDIKFKAEEPRSKVPKPQQSEPRPTGSAQGGGCHYASPQVQVHFLTVGRFLGTQSTVVLRRDTLVGLEPSAPTNTVVSHPGLFQYSQLITKNSINTLCNDFGRFRGLLVEPAASSGGHPRGILPDFDITCKPFRPSALSNKDLPRAGTLHRLRIVVA